jgi:hypothetical protein
MTIGMSGFFFAMADNAFGGYSFEISNALGSALATQQETPPGG